MISWIYVIPTRFRRRSPGTNAKAKLKLSLGKCKVDEMSAEEQKLTIPSGLQDVRNRLCYALSRDLAENLVSDPKGIDRMVEMLSAGFQGFSSMSDAELVDAVYEAGLEDQNLADVDLILGADVAA